MSAIIKKELRSFSRNISTYFFITISLLIGGFYFSRPILNTGAHNLIGAFEDVNTLLPIFLPLLTMNTFAQERGAQTDKILLTGRSSIFTVVMAKFVSVFLIYSGTMTAIYLFPIMYLLFNAAALGNVLLMYFGQLLFGAVIIAFGIFLSSMSSHPSRAGIVTIAAILLWWMLSNILPNIQNKVLQGLVSFISLFTYLDTFSHGLLQLSSVCTLLSFTIIFILFTAKTLQGWRAGRNG